ncbi:hypothetical protein [Anabaena lutea]|uniref:TIR domain-containing protein n=1 Tax=Anabaena lutea FACHB-196 TaxID=2692881 RepID=A0ABR8FGT1_9NOST|nr:hypothetical protein [Anabaena lutea]MBD2569055.1 hypothetical protein [Anabaena lutea FACHB-196]
MDRRKVLIITSSTVIRRIIKTKIISKSSFLEVIEAKNAQEGVELLTRESANIVLIIIAKLYSEIECEDVVKYIQNDQGLCFIPLIIMVYDGTPERYIFQDQEKTEKFVVLQMPFADEEFRKALKIAIDRQR